MALADARTLLFDSLPYAAMLSEQLQRMLSEIVKLLAFADDFAGPPLMAHGHGSSHLP